MRRYVILFHQTPPSQPRPAHWDLMLETGQALRTWALAEAPHADRPIAAEALPDHRLAFLSYEGPISGGRGHVSRWDRGEITWLIEAPDHVTARLEGQQLQGEIQLTTADPNCRSWEFLFTGVAERA